ncbi:Hypothetical predicted protein, partial [Mytilus galloprovincialis]
VEILTDTPHVDIPMESRFINEAQSEPVKNVLEIMEVYIDFEKEKVSRDSIEKNLEPLIGQETIIQDFQDLKSYIERRQPDVKKREEELPMSPQEPNGHYIEQEPSAPMVPDALNDVPSNIVNGDHQLHIICSGNEILKDKSTCSYSYSSETFLKIVEITK